MNVGNGAWGMGFWILDFGFWIVGNWESGIGFVIRHSSFVIRYWDLLLTSSPLHLFTSSPPHLFTPSPLHPFISPAPHAPAP
jgi:hypothetical protein